MDHTFGDPVSHQNPADVRPSERGFTLVELMVVVAIIALLASVVIPNFVHARAQAAVSQSEANIKQIATALELYYTDKEDYPTGQTTVIPTLFGAAATNPYLSVTPTNALTRQPYGYAYTARTAAGVQPTYKITDPGNYEPSTLSSLTKGAQSTTLCGLTGCKTINYDPQNGFYGS